MAVSKAGIFIEGPRGETRHDGTSYDEDNFDGCSETDVGDDNEMQQSDEHRRKDEKNQRLDEQKQEDRRRNPFCCSPSLIL